MKNYKVRTNYNTPHQYITFDGVWLSYSLRGSYQIQLLKRIPAVGVDEKDFDAIYSLAKKYI